LINSFDPISIGVAMMLIFCRRQMCFFMQSDFFLRNLGTEWLDKWCFIEGLYTPWRGFVAESRRIKWFYHFSGCCNWEVV